MGLCDECCAVGYFVLLSLVQRHALVFVQVWRETWIVNGYFCTREESGFRQQSCVLLSKRIRMNSNHTPHRPSIDRVDIVKPQVALTCVSGFEWVVLREDCLAHRTPFRPESDRCVPRVELQVKRQLVST